MKLNKTSILHIMPFLTALLCYLCTQKMLSTAGWEWCSILILLTFISTKRYAGNQKNIHGVFTKKKYMILFFMLYIIYCMGIYGYWFLEDHYLSVSIVENILLILASSSWVYLIYVQCISIALDYSKHKCSNRESGMTKKNQVILFCVLMVNYIVWIYAFNPCITTPDSHSIFDLIHSTGIYGMVDWHPPFYVMVVSLLLNIWDSVTFIVLLQCLIYSFLLVRIANYLYKEGLNVSGIIFVIFILGFLFSNTIQLVTFWRDIPYMMSLLWLTYCLVRIIRGEQKKVLLVELCISIIFVSLFRQNGVLPAAMIAIVIVCFAIRNKKKALIIPIIIAMATFGIIRGPIYNAYNIKPAPNLKFFALANDIMGVYYSVEDPEDEIKEMANDITNNNPEGWEHNPYYTKCNGSSLLNYSIPRFVSVYIKTFFNHPIELCREFLRRNSVLWSVVKPEEEVAGCVNTLVDFHREEEAEYMYPRRTINAATGALTAISRNLTENKLLYIFTWRTSIYLIAILTLAYVAMIQRKYRLLIPIIPLLSNTFSLLLGSGWPDYRYYWPTEILAVFLISIVFIGRNSQVSEMNNGV